MTHAGASGSLRRLASSLKKRFSLSPVLRAGLLLASFLMGCACSGGAMGFTVSGSWSRVIDAGDLAGAAGSDLVPTFDSMPTAVSLGVTGTTGPADTWEIQVSRTDVSWDSQLHLSVMRTSAGTGPGTMAGGLAFLEILPLEQSFLTGSGDRSSIQVQVRLSGVSVLVAQGSYAVTVNFTLIDTP